MLDSAAALTAAHAGQSGLALVSDNLDAFALRALTARSAARRLDLMYYYWRDDLTGGLLAREILNAADRGVSVRILIDDISTRARDNTYVAFMNHPNIQFRLFNPVMARVNPVRRRYSMIKRAINLTRRMHNKAWICDGVLAIVGGRNIGDAYFDASRESNFRDMDLVLLGPAVEQTRNLFEAYWTCAVTVRVKAVSRRKADLAAVRRRLEALASIAKAEPYRNELIVERDAQSMLAEDLAFHWTDKASVVSDPPEKAEGEKETNWLSRELFPVLLQARQKIEIISPYFIPGPSGVEKFVEMVDHGIDVAISTNSLAATDEITVHGAYAKYRRPLLEGGVRLYELRPENTKRRRRHLFASAGASLHTKAFTVDDRWGFVGSFNFDPRSVSLNTEMGVLFEDPRLTAELSANFARQIAPDESYRLSLDGGRLFWEERNDGVTRIWNREPKARIWLRSLAKIIGWLPIEWQL